MNHTALLEKLEHLHARIGTLEQSVTGAHLGSGKQNGNPSRRLHDHAGNPAMHGGNGSSSNPIVRDMHNTTFHIRLESLAHEIMHVVKEWHETDPARRMPFSAWFDGLKQFIASYRREFTKVQLTGCLMHFKTPSRFTVILNRAMWNTVGRAVNEAYAQLPS